MWPSTGGWSRAMGDPSFAGATILAVFAHPDDESLACGGTLARVADAGARVVLICASRGSRGPVSDPPLVVDRDLGVLRAQELRAAAAELAISEVVLLDHPDGSLRWADVSQFHAELVIALRRYRPDAVLTFGKDGLYWHGDHIGVHERVSTAVESLGADAPPLYYVTMPRGVMQEVVDAARRQGAAPSDTTFWGIQPAAFGKGADPPTFVIDVERWISRKMTALRCHRTQIGVHNPLAWISEDDARRALGREQFRRASENCAMALIERIGEPAAAEV